MKKNLLIIVLLVLGFGGTAYALPYFSNTQTIIPFLDNAYDIGTTTARYRNLYLSGTCTGCGTGSIFPFTPQSWGNATSTVLGFPGFIATASSTLSYLGSGIVGSNNGNLYATASSTLFGSAMPGYVWSYQNGSAGWFATSTSGAGTVTAVTATSPIFSSGGATPNITWAGLATTSQPASSNLLVSNGGTGVFGVGTSSPTFNGGLTTSGTAGAWVGGSSYTVSLANVNANSLLGCVGGAACTPTSVATTSIFSGTTGQFPYFSGTNTLTATSSIFLAANGNVGIASSSPAFTLSVNNSGSDFEIYSTGEIVGRDTTNGWIGRVSPTRSFVLSVATTTEWTASTTNSGYSPFLTMPFAGTLQDTRCLVNGTSTALFIGVNTQIAGSNATPSYFVASSTAGKIAFTAGNTFTAGQKILANFGTTTISDAQGIACTYDVIETP